MDADSEVDIFIANSLYPDYLNRVTHDERRVLAMQYKYRGTQLIETLDKFLMAADSPMYTQYNGGQNPSIASATSDVPVNGTSNG